MIADRNDLSLEAVVKQIDETFARENRIGTHLAAISEGQWKTLKANLKNTRPTNGVPHESGPSENHD